jgi:uncharacterized protein YqhQ
MIFLTNFLLALSFILFFAVLFALVTIGRRKDMQIFAFHSAEHAIINKYDHPSEGDSDRRIYNDRCSLVVFFWASVFLALLVTFLKVPEYNIFWAGSVVLGLILLSFSLSYEVVLGLSSIEGSVFNYIFIKPLNLLQYFFLSYPEDRHLVIGKAALEEVLRLEKKDI